MTLVVDDVINAWEVSSLLDFISQFEIEKYFLKVFKDKKDIQDIYESDYYDSDDYHIQEWLEQDKKFYTMREVNDRNGQIEYWEINEVKK
jgi:hypothetical protein|tara:strand:+ start:85 stop:354 length:270 start_codon:yes stop_codon:yes gene_type:complete